MALAIQPGESDLYLPQAEPGTPPHPYTVHTYYFGLSVPEAGIGAYIYLRCQPAFGISQGGPVIFRGLDNLSLLDADYHDYRATMPWPEVEGGRVSVANGLVIDIAVPGELIRLSYASPDGETGFELEQRAVTPLFVRGHIVPGEEEHHGDPARRQGGSEQFMHCTGELRLRGEQFEVDCHAVRDRSWNQVRAEDPGGAQQSPPIGWSPAWFGEDLAFNVTSFEAQDTEPGWAGVYDVPADRPSSFYKWLVRNGEPRELVSVRRNVLERDPRTFMPARQELDLVDEAGETHHFDGELISVANVHSWPNIAFHDSLYRWTDDTGRVAHCTYQEIWWDRYQRAMKTRHLP